MTYARLYLADVLPESVSRVLFLDVDILVLGSIKALLTLDVKDNVIAAVMDGMDQPLGNGRPFQEGVPKVKKYFNAGVLLVDLEKWRAHGIADKGLKYLSEFPNSPFSDQDALNVACDEKWLEVKDEWNYQDHWAKRFSMLDRENLPKILHFVAGSKPWDPRMRSVNFRFYDRFRSRTAFSRSRAQRLQDEFVRFCAGVGNVGKRYGW